MKKKTEFPRILAHVLEAGLVLFVLFALYLCLFPVKLGTLASRPFPSASYEESDQRIKNILLTDTPEVQENARAIFLGHGHKVKNAIVFFHGFTNSPRQFAQLGKEFYNRGYNVYIPRVPYHGLNASAVRELAHLKAEDLTKTADESVDIAAGLGERITVVGLSMGGVMAGWAAQKRPDVDKAVLIAPNFGTFKIPDFFLKPSINFLLLKRDMFIWWDKNMRENMPRPESAYTGFSSRALGEIRRLGYGVQVLAHQNRPESPSILVITNANDRAVSQEGIDAVVNEWRKYSEVDLEYFEFEKDLGLGHDLIDPEQPNQKVDVVYPKLLELIDKP